MQIIPGTIQSLPVNDQNERGYMLGNDTNVVFLPKRDVKDELNEGDEVKVFTFYNDQQELEATTMLPVIELGQMICIKTKNSNTMGAFVDIGTKRDILIPIKEQREAITAGQMVLMLMREDRANRRLFGTTRISSNIINKDMSYERGQEVEITIAELIEVGRRVVVNGIHFGILFNNEIMDKLHFGQKVKGYVRMVEGKDLTVSMQREGLDLLTDAKDRILNFLKANNGYVRLNDETTPDEIKLRLKMSKKTFKKASGMLFKEGVVTLTKLGIKLNKELTPQSDWVNTKEEPKEENKSVQPRKPFVDKRNYKGRINEFDERNKLVTQKKTRDYERPADAPHEEQSERPYKPERNETRERKPARDTGNTEVSKGSEQKTTPSREPQRVLKRREKGHSPDSSEGNK